MFLFPFSGPLPAFSRCFVPSWGLVFGFRENQASGSSLTKEQFELQVSNQLRKSGFAERSCWSPIVNSQSLSLQLLVQRKNKNDRRDEYSQLSNGLQLECRYSRLPIHLEIWMQNLFPVLLFFQSNLLTQPQGRLVCWQRRSKLLELRTRQKDRATNGWVLAWRKMCCGYNELLNSVKILFQSAAFHTNQWCWWCLRSSIIFKKTCLLICSVMTW